MLSCFSYVWLFATSWTEACQASLSMEFFWQGYYNRLLFPTPGDLPNPGIKPVSLQSSPSAGDSLPLCHLGTLKGLKYFPFEWWNNSSLWSFYLHFSFSLQLYQGNFPSASLHFPFALSLSHLFHLFIHTNISCILMHFETNIRWGTFIYINLS